MKAWRGWTNREEAIVIADAAAGVSADETAARIGRDRDAVRDRRTVLRKRGVPVPLGVPGSVKGSDGPQWPADKITRLRELWLAVPTLSTAEIGRQLRMSKGAVVGKAHRLELPGRPSPIRRSDAPRVAPVKRVRSVPLPVAASESRDVAVLPTPPPASDAHRLPVPAGSRTCQFITGEQPWKFCDKPVERGSYCAEHHILCTIRHTDHRPGAPVSHGERA